MRSSLRLLTLAITLAAPTASWADRALSPTDSLGDWAYEGTLGIGGINGDRVVLTGSSPREVDLDESGFIMQLRVWPGRGWYVGGHLRSTVIQHNDGSIADLGGTERGLSDLRFLSGIRRRVTPSAMLGGELDLVVPSGTDVHSRERFEALAEVTLGFSFTPRWDFYITPRAAYRRGPGMDPLTGARAGFEAGFAYQRERFLLLGHGFNLGHREEDDYLSTGGGARIGWESWPGVVFSLGFSGGTTKGRPRDLSYTATDLSVTFVYYGSDKHNRLRVRDANRGVDWLWWERPPPPP